VAANASEIQVIPAYLQRPDITPAQAKGLMVANKDRPLAVFEGDAEPVLARIRDGEKAKYVAKSLGVSDVALYAFLLRNAPTAWLELSAGKALQRKAEAEEALDDENADRNKIARARTSAQLAQWDLEKANRKLYGESKADSGGTTVQVLVQRDGGVSTNVLRDDE
jgi:hypothetical protein